VNRHRHQADRPASAALDWALAEPLREADIAEHVAHYVDGPGHRASDYDWYFHPAVPLAALHALESGTGPSDDSPAGWRQWLQRERAVFRAENDLDEFDDDPWGGDFRHWLTTGGLWERDTAIVATEQHGWRPGFGVHDGNHRVATAHEQDMAALRAYLGVRKRP
jgi:hypothetical protein